MIFKSSSSLEVRLLCLKVRRLRSRQSTWCLFRSLILVKESLTPHGCIAPPGASNIKTRYPWLQHLPANIISSACVSNQVSVLVLAKVGVFFFRGRRMRSSLVLLDLLTFHKIGRISPKIARRRQKPCVLYVPDLTVRLNPQFYISAADHFAKMLK